MIENLKNHERAQNIARETIRILQDWICTGMSEAGIAQMAEYRLIKLRSGYSWYHNVLALVYVGRRTTMSISGKDYKPYTSQIVQYEDLVTIDLSPTFNGCWGDYARSLIVSDGKVVDREKANDSRLVKMLWRGVITEQKIHQKFLETARPDMTFADVYTLLTEELNSLGHENLDFKGNLGHTIEKNLDDRRNIVPESKLLLKNAGLFTIEPHIRQKEIGEYGFKHENIYYCQDNRVVEL